MASLVEKLKLGNIKTNGGTQPRTALNEQTVAEYAEAITEGAKLPPVVVFHDGADHWLADGFHRFFATKKIGAYEIEAEIHNGTKRDAVLYSVGANSSHGLRRTNEDKRKAVLTLLEDAEWVKWSDNQIARACGVAHSFVGRVRSSLDSKTSDELPERTYTTKHGTEAVMSTGNIGKKKDVAHAAPAPNKRPARTLESQPLPEEQMDGEDELAEAHHTITELAAENDRLNDQLLSMDASDEGKARIAQQLADLRQQIETKDQEIAALKASRDTYMHQVAEIKKQVNYWRKKAEKVAA